MARATSAVARNKHRKEILKRTKGFMWGRKNKERQAKIALYKGGEFAFAHRKKKKNDFRRLWIVRINAATRALGFGSYSKLINTLTKKEIELDRKVLATLAKDKPEIFERFIKEIS
ncbi:50S ribosomal protein L20 [Candidatus Wolfebacteria bacterium]|nr:50S ribosomal protein L20 [Candidatus Wolfebacteria bacterium]